MSVKFFIYIIMAILVIYSLDSVNINQIFKKNKITQARIFYLLLALSLIHLTTEFVYNFFLASRII